MDDYNNKQNGELRGFDEVTNENGYTVTPDGGFYTKSREDIIQDEALNLPSSPITHHGQRTRLRQSRRLGRHMPIPAQITAAIIDTTLITFLLFICFFLFLL